MCATTRYFPLKQRSQGVQAMREGKINNFLNPVKRIPKRSRQLSGKELSLQKKSALRFRRILAAPLIMLQMLLASRRAY